MRNGRTYKPGITGWVACDYTQGDTIQEVEHSDVYDSYSEAKSRNDSWREVYGDDYAYEGIRRVGADGNLRVDERYLHEDDHPELYYDVCIVPTVQWWIWRI